MNQQRTNPPARQPTENEQITRRGKMERLLAEIRLRRDEIVAVLPSDIPYAKFEAAFNMAVRREPGIVECYGPSVIRAVIQCAYDGCLPDGREAVILVSNNRYKDPTSGQTKSRKEARYQIMVYGMRKKIVDAGAARHIEATVVYKNEPFVYTKGLHPRLEHEPILDDAQRGDMLAVYSVAILPDGDHVFEVMTKGDVMAVKAVSKTDTVWTGPFQAEMWRKSVLRRHSKALPTNRPIRDAEAQDLFPQFQGQPAATDLPALGSPAAPTRAEFAHLDAPDVDLPLDLSGFDGEGETIEHERAETAAKPKPRKAKPAQKKAAAPAETAAKAEPTPEPVPTTLPEWEKWKREKLVAIGQCKTVEDLDALQKISATDQAPPAHRNDVENSFMDKRIDLQESSDAE